MSGKWFANRGQAIQAGAAIASLCVAIGAFYFVLKSNNSLPKASAILYASVAVFLLLAGILIGRRLGTRSSTVPPADLPASSESGMRHSGNATATSGSATATGGSVSLHVHSAAPVHAAPPPKVEDEPMPLLEFVQCEWVRLPNHDYPLRIEDIGSCLLTAKFRNPRLGVGRTTPTAYRVHAQLTFRSINHKETCVHHGHWIGEYTHFAQFGPGESRALVVALSRDAKLAYTLENRIAIDPRTRRIRSGVTVLHAPQTVPLGGDTGVVEIALVSGEVTLYEHQFVLTCETDGTMRLA